MLFSFRKVIIDLFFQKVIIITVFLSKSHTHAELMLWTKKHNMGIFFYFNRTNQLASQGQPMKLNNAFLYKITKYFVSPILNIKIVQLADCLCLILQHHFGFTNILFTRLCFHTCSKNVNFK